MTSMVEKVARALRKFAAEMEVSSNGEKSPDVMVHSHELARAAIEAMREPTEAVMAAINEHAGSIAPEYAWRDGIDAALSEETR